MTEQNHFEICEVNDPALWDTLIEDSPQGTIFMRSFFLEAMDFDIDYLAVKYKDEIVAITSIPHKDGVPALNSEKLNQYNAPCLTRAAERRGGTER